MPAVKLNISLPEHTARTLKCRASERNTPVSRYLAELIEEDYKRAQDELAEEGYRLLAADTKQVCEAFWPLSAELQWEWDEEPANGKDT